MSMKTAFKSDLFRVFCIIVLASIAMHLILRSNISGSAILYVGIPVVIAGLLLINTEKMADHGWKARFARVSRYSLIIMLASSAILFEGFLCVVMFMPIYFGMIFIVYLIKNAYENNKKRRSTHLHILPLLLVAASLEGVTPELSFNRYNEVTSTQIVNVGIGKIKQNLIQPVELDQPRHWFLSLFPMPYQMDARSLTEGEIHTIHYRYHRWFVTNTHEGHTSLKVAEVSEQRIRLEVVEDTSYLAHYLKVHGTEINLKPMGADKTEVRLTIKYDRLLDPAWYFDPLQSVATGLLGKYLIRTMMERSTT